ncbi:MAG: PD40 domain-containing protein, partial [Acidobacteria bacterium]|nr:PD40 domain-containing protein [Acidobacteriota bacterium]
MTTARVLIVLATVVLLAPAHAQQKPADKWDVTAANGPVTQMAFDTNEGTWMNVDVSPDGKRVVFDLLGDIYTMPIDGSGSAAATRIAGGATFDMQPRFSPDGRRIAFTSDRDGLWNIWTMDPDGKSPTQISRDKRWFINSPTWSPDGAYIYARRHFVAERSLGAGEIWVFHSSGPSDGLQVTERTGSQKDNGEPDISPDGRYLYYSKDVTPGLNFEYNKDPNGTIYAVMRRDLTTGRERRAVSVQGGSVTPQASPDGKTLAYIRRARLQSHLFLRDLETGQDRQLFGNIDKDLQEAWAIHGLYPQYAWMPDGKGIVIWGEGKIWKVDVASGKGQSIPFNVHVEATITEAVRYKQNVHTDEFPVRMLRDVRVSPDGKMVAYSALGQIYTRTLPDGKPQRLTRDARFEFFPSWSRDGQWIVYTTWSDAEKGRVRVIKPDGSGAREVGTKPGHYVEPSFSPDGQKIVYRHAGGDQSRGPLFGDDAGIYVTATAGGEPLLAREGGGEAEFDHTGTRLYVRDFRNNAYTLLSIGVPTASSPLPGRDEIEHIKSSNATEYAISPNGDWIAFEERFKTFVAPFPRTGRVVEISPTTQSYPVQRISRDAGFFLHWSGDSRKVYWTLGPELFSRDVVDTFSFAAKGGSSEPAGGGGSPRTLKTDPEAKGINISFTAMADKPTGSIALVGARVITMAGLKPGAIQGTPGVIENATIVIDGNRISAVGPSSSVQVPAGSRRVDVKGKTIMPG